MALNGVGNVELLCVNAEHFSRNMLGSRTWAGRVEGRRYNFDTVLVDPPRAGLDASTRGKVAAYPFIMVRQDRHRTPLLPLASRVMEVALGLLSRWRGVHRGWDDLPCHA